MIHLELETVWNGQPHILLCVLPDPKRDPVQITERDKRSIVANDRHSPARVTVGRSSRDGRERPAFVPRVCQRCQQPITNRLMRTRLYCSLACRRAWNAGKKRSLYQAVGR